MKLLIINYMIGIIIGALPILIICFWPERLLGGLGRIIGFCEDCLKRSQ